MNIHDGVDPSPLLVLEFLSEEVSGPETSGEERLEGWTRQIAALDNYNVMNISSEDLQKLRYFEIIRPNWRSKEVRVSFN